jgi:hypothetical protein
MWKNPPKDRADSMAMQRQLLNLAMRDCRTHCLWKRLSRQPAEEKGAALVRLQKTHLAWASAPAAAEAAIEAGDLS